MDEIYIKTLLTKNIKSSWIPLITKCLESSEGIRILSRLANEYNKATIFPRIENIFNAFSYCELEDIKVVIIGQDPYHNENQAMGLAFSVGRGSIKIPPSIYRILKEAGITNNDCTDLTSWAKQGVLLLNTVLTVEKGKPNSHAKWGWGKITDMILRDLSEKSNGPLVFLLWGLKAQAKKKIINIDKHHIICTSHPSPLATKGDFIGSKCFVKTNDYLVSIKKKPIDWCDLKYNV